MAAVVRFESGARGVIEATTGCLPDLCSRVEVFGTNGAVAFDDAIATKFGVNGEDLLGTLEQDQERIGGGSAPMAISFKGHEAQMADFVDAINKNRKPMVSGEDARMSVEALNLIYHRAFPGIKLGT